MLSAIDRGMLARDIGAVTLLKDRIPIEGSTKQNVPLASHLVEIRQLIKHRTSMNNEVGI